MRLRTQVVLGIAVAFAVIVAVVVGVVAPHVRRSFSDIEQAEVQRNVERATNALRTELATLEAVVHDWAAWDDTSAFVQGSAPQFAQANLIPETFINLQLDAMAFFDASGRLVAAQGYAFDREELVDAPEQDLDLLASLVPPGGASEEADGRSGLVSRGDDLALVAAHPILSSLHEPPVRGTLVIERILNAERVERLAAQVRLPLLLRPIDDPESDPGLLAALSNGDPDDPSPVVVPINERTVAGYTVWRNLQGEPIAVLGVEVPRDASRAGLAASLYLTGALLLAFVVLSGGFLLFLDRRVLARTAHLTKTVSRIAKDQNPSARVPVRGNDELATLGQNINGMLESIEESRVAVERSERRYHNLFESSRDPIYITAADGRFVDANPALLDLFGYTRTEIMTMKAGDLYARREDRDAFRAAILEKGFVVSYPVTLVRKDGAPVRCLLTTITERLPETDEIVYQGIIRDITELLRQQEKLTYLATHDPLTGLLTRGALDDVLSLEIARAMRNLERLAVFYLDVDRFKQVNDTHGHAAGDRVLQEVATRLRDSLRASDAVARLGGDEFVALLPGIDSPRDAEIAADKILRVLRDAFRGADQARGLSVSIGIALFPDDDADGAHLLQRADAAMYVAKHQGRDGWRRYARGANGVSTS